MSVYVDPLIDYGWRLGPSCHMTADSDAELHAMAAKIGMPRSWFQGPPKHSTPHYDLVASKRKLAVKAGAIEQTWREAGRRTLAQAAQRRGMTLEDVEERMIRKRAEERRAHVSSARETRHER